MSENPSIFNKIHHRSRFSLQLRWYDWRVTFVNLKAFKDNFNSLGLEEMERIWKPKMIFTNSVEEASLVYDAMSSIFVQRQGESSPNPLSEIHENEIFTGIQEPAFKTNFFARNSPVGKCVDFSNAGRFWHIVH